VVRGSRKGTTEDAHYLVHKEQITSIVLRACSSNICKGSVQPLVSGNAAGGREGSKNLHML
jgi:hypothetical protein